MDQLDKELEEAKARLVKEEGLQMQPSPENAAPETPVAEPEKAEATPDPVQQVATPAPNAESEALKAQLEAANQKVAELTQRINSDDGRRGGELRNLRESVETMRAQMLTLVDENRKLAELAKKPAAQAPEVPAVDEDEEKAFAEHFPGHAKKLKALEATRQKEIDDIRKATEESNKKTALLERQAQQTATQRFTTEVQSKVPGFLEVIRDPAFNAWAETTRIKGTPLTYGRSYDLATESFDSSQAVEVLDAWNEHKKASAPVATPVAEVKATPPKPSKEAQATPPAAAGGAIPVAKGSGDKGVNRAARIKELEMKVFETRKATDTERAELEKLWRDEATEKDKAA